MHDPFPLPPPTFFVRIVRPFCNSLGLTTLPLHLHEILLAAALYTFISTRGSQYISRLIIPKIYASFSPRTRLNWDVHVVSLFQSLLVCGLALYVMFADEERKDMSSKEGGWEERVWGYTGAGGMVQAFAAGYFLWDLGICLLNFKVFGFGLLAHAIAALVVFSFGFVSSLPLGCSVCRLGLADYRDLRGPLSTSTVPPSSCTNCLHHF